MNNKETLSQPCVNCQGGTMTFQQKEELITYKDQVHAINLEAYWCDTCEEAIFDSKALRIYAESFSNLKARVDGNKCSKSSGSDMECKACKGKSKKFCSTTGDK